MLQFLKTNMIPDTLQLGLIRFLRLINDKKFAYENY